MVGIDRPIQALSMHHSMRHFLWNYFQSIVKLYFMLRTEDDSGYILYGTRHFLWNYFQSIVKLYFMLRTEDDSGYILYDTHHFL